MVWITYPPMAAYDPTTRTALTNAQGQIFAVEDLTYSSPLPIRDASGVPMTFVKIGDVPLTDEFQVEDKTKVIFKSGPYALVVQSLEGLVANSLAARTAAESAAVSAEASRQAAVAAAGSGGGGGLPAGTTLEQIPNGGDRLAMTQAERDKLLNVAYGATKVTVGYNAGQAMPSSARAAEVVAVGVVGVLPGTTFRKWKPRPASQGWPTIAEGAQDGDEATLYQDI